MRRLSSDFLAVLLTTCFLGCGEANVNPAPDATTGPQTALEAVGQMKEMHPDAVSKDANKKLAPK